MATTAAPASLEERIARLEAQRNVPMPTERLARIEGAYEHLATKADLQTVKSEPQGAMAAVKSELQGAIAAVKSELQGAIAAVKSDIAVVQSEQRALKWLMGIGIAGILYPPLRDLLAQLP